MSAASQHLIDTNDLNAFRSAACQAKSPVRELRRLDNRRSGDYVVFELAANAFLHHMVRNIVGSLVYVGKGKHGPAWMAEVLASRDRRLAAPTLEAAGLYLERVSYDVKWGLPPAGRDAWVT